MNEFSNTLDRKGYGLRVGLLHLHRLGPLRLMEIFFSWLRLIHYDVDIRKSWSPDARGCGSSVLSTSACRGVLATHGRGLSKQSSTFAVHVLNYLLVDIHRSQFKKNA